MRAYPVTMDASQPECGPPNTPVEENGNVRADLPPIEKAAWSTRRVISRKPDIVPHLGTRLSAHQKMGHVNMKYLNLMRKLGDINFTEDGLDL